MNSRILFTFMISAFLFLSCKENNNSTDPDDESLPDHSIVTTDLFSIATFEEVSNLPRNTKMKLRLNRDGFEVQEYEIFFESVYDFNNERLIFCRTPKNLPVGAGDSGSPVVTSDGRIAGALCYGFQGSSNSFAARAIEDLIALENSTIAKNQKIINKNSGFFLSISPVYFSSRLTPGLYSKIKSEDKFSFFKRFYAESFSRSVNQKSLYKSNTMQLAGSSIAVMEVNGDILNAGAVGTLSYNKGNNSFAFGHEFSSGNTSPLAAPVYKAEVITFVESYITSQKIAVPTNETLGSLASQNLNGIMINRLKQPKVFPSEITVKVTNKESKTYTHYISSSINISYEHYIADLTIAYSLEDYFMNYDLNGQFLVSGNLQIITDNSQIDTTFDLAMGANLVSDIYYYLDNISSYLNLESHLKSFKVNLDIKKED